MTVFYKPVHSGRGGRGADPRRMMIADDLGLSLLKQWDPVMLAAGIKVPRLNNRQLNTMRFAAIHAVHRPKRDEELDRMRELGRFNRTVEAKIVRQEVRLILSRMRRLGEVRR